MHFIKISEVLTNLFLIKVEELRLNLIICTVNGETSCSRWTRRLPTSTPSPASSVLLPTSSLLAQRKLLCSCSQESRDLKIDLVGVPLLQWKSASCRFHSSTPRREWFHFRTKQPPGCSLERPNCWEGDSSTFPHHSEVGCSRSSLNALKALDAHRSRKLSQIWEEHLLATDEEYLVKEELSTYWQRQSTFRRKPDHDHCSLLGQLFEKPPHSMRVLLSGASLATAESLFLGSQRRTNL